MQGLCTALSNSGFWQGLWDGITAPITLIASIFFNVSFYDVCTRSWWYNCMFLFGILISLALGIMRPQVAVFVFFVSLAAFLIWLIFANILYILTFVAIVAICVMAVWVYKIRFDPRRPLRQRDGSELLPPS